jgi:hypothetical protein
MRDITFYSTAAQVIPVFLLVLIFERRFFEVGDESASLGLSLISFLIACAGGEFLALATLLGDDPPSEFTEVLVMCALVWAGLGLFVPLFRPRLARLGQTLPSPVVTVTRVGWLPLLLVIVLLASICYDADIIPAAVVTLWALTLVGSWFVSGSPMFKAKRPEKDDSHAGLEATRDDSELSGTERE